MRFPHTPGGLAADRHGAWLLPYIYSSDPPRLRKLSRKGVVSSSYALDGNPQSIATGFGAVWVLDVDGTVTRFDPDTGAPSGTQLTAARTAPNVGHSFTVGENAVWVSSGGDGDVGSISRLDPTSGRIVGSPTPITCPDDMAAGEGALFIVSTDCDGRSGITRIDAGTAAVTSRSLDLTVFNEITVGFGSVWLNNGTNKLLRVTADELKLQTPVDVGFGVEATVVLGGSLWVVGDGKVARVNPSSGKVANNQVRLGGKLTYAVAGAGELWVLNVPDVQRLASAARG